MRTTCGISKLPIYNGDYVYQFLLMPNFYSQGARHSAETADMFHVVMGDHFYGHWNDDTNCIDTPRVSAIMESYLKTLPFYVQTDYSTDPDACEYKVYQWVSMSAFLQAVGCQNIYLKHPMCNRFELVEYILVHAKLYFQIMESIRNRVPKRHSEKLSILTEEKIRAIIKYMTDNATELSWEYGFWDDFKDLYASSMTMCDSLQYWAEAYIHTPENAPYRDGIIIQMVDYILWRTAMSISGYGYYCTCDYGDYHDFAINKIVAKFVLEKCDAFEKEYCEDSDTKPDGCVLEMPMYFRKFKS